MLDARRRTSHIPIHAVAAALSVLAWATIRAETEQTRLVDAVKSRDAQLVARLLGRKVDVNVPQADGSTALHWAAHWDDEDLVRELIVAGANVRAADDLAVTPLLVASTNGNAAIVAMLLKAGADPNAVPVSGESPLMMAARSGNDEAVRILVVSGADVNAQEPLQGQTVLMWAAAHDQAHVIERLVHAGAELQARTKTQKSTPLMFAAREGALHAARKLLDLGARVNDADVDGSTPLVAAVTLGHWTLARVLLESGADPNIDAAGYTALHWVCGAWEGELSGRFGSDKYLWMAGLGDGKRELVEALLAHGANPNARIVKAPPRIDRENVRTRLKPIGATPFLLAAHAGRTDIMRILLARGADPLATTADNTTPLMAAAGFGRMNASSRVLESDAIEAARLTLALGNNIHAANGQGDTALHAASYAGWNNVIQFLVENGARVNDKNKRGWTALTIAEGFLDVTTGSVPSFHPETAALLRKLGGVSDKADSKPVDGR